MKALRTIPCILLSLVAAACGGAATATPTTNTAATTATSTQGSSDIVDTAVAAGSFKTLAAALKAATSWTR